MSDAAVATNDRPLTAEHISQLVDSQHLLNFFAYLGYDVDRSISLDHATLGLDSADLRQQIRSIRRVGADPAEGDIVIYLLEARSVTVALTQAVARRFRERPESALLVLTKDFEALDFVLVERELAQGRRPGSGLRQVIRPRVLTVKRRAPDPVALRVLQRFTFTEGDSLYQWEKLRSAFTLAEWTEQYFNNRALFSDYYLLERLTDPTLTPAWDEDVRPIGREVLRHLAGARAAYSGQPEQAMRAGLYEPLFRSLGFEFDVHKPGDSDLDEPDYILYAAGDRSKPLAQVMTYVWNRNLDDADETRDRQTPDEIPGALVVNVLAKAGTNWVVVTNGKLWRLYSASAANKATNYYEIDLEEAVHAPDQLTALKYWWLFFRRQAFTGFLDELVQRSADYAKGLGERLKERTFTTIFPHFARGFIEHARASQKLDFSEKSNFSPADKSNFLVFQATLTFLYRLMFILYAESLALLPVTEERGYGEFSLARLKRELAAAGGPIEDEAPKKLAQRYRTDSTELYERLQLLFNGIDAGDPALNLPMYNGGLFSDASPEGRFLAGHAIPDRYLALGLDRLCRDVDDKTQALAMIDYKSLGVRQLGSIYEGLLEFKLRVAAEPLAVVKEKGKEVYLPAKEASSKRVVATLAQGDVYLENDKRERKATGSYYTPDYIVKYIVEHTVGPVLEAKFAALEPRLRAAQKLYRQRREHARAKGEDPEKFWNNADMQRLADDCLDVRVLDPAMGSGHFLVEAVDFVGDRLIQFLNAWSENPVWALLARTRQDILLDMERQGVSIDAERLTRVSLLKRSVLKRCIYGVDLNPMAVELAKVSLWLDAFTLGAPLSFLDHHLKCGNSLIGGRIREAQALLAPREGETYSLLAGNQWAGVMLATDLMRQVSFLSDNTVGQLAESQAAFRSAADHLAPYKRILDVATSRWFGNGPAKSGFEPALELLRRPEAEAWLRAPDLAAWPEKDYMAARQVAEIALQAAAGKRFFHWELEFPEVFFAPATPGGQDVQLREDGGFDAVIGNPPWGGLRSLGEAGPYLGTKFKSASQAPDWFALFLEQTTVLAKRDGQIGQVIPGGWQTASGSTALRRYLAERFQIRTFVNLPYDVFPDAYTEAVIITGCMESGSEPAWHSARPRILVFDRREKITNIRANDHRWFSIPVARWFELAPDNFPFLTFLAPQLVELTFKVRQISIPLSKIADVQRGITPFQPTVGTPDHVHSVALDGELVRYSYEFNGTHVVEYHTGIAEYKDPRYFRGERVIVRQLISRQFRLQGILTRDDFVVNQSHQVVLLNEEHWTYGYVLAIINSRLISHLYVQGSALAMRDDFPKLVLDDTRSLPIREVDFTTEDNRRAQLATKGRALYQRCLAEGHACVLDFVAHHLERNESDVVHDLLAFLAGQMIELNQQKQAETRRFLGWLEGTLRIKVPGTADSARHLAGIDSLTGKTLLQGYLGDYQKGERETPWADFYFRLHQNRNRFAVSLEQVKGEIEAEYERSLALLLPIKRQLAATDALIDQIVYRLYGLTDEEIAIVEGPAYQQALGEAKAETLKDKKLAADPEAAAEAIAGKVLPAAQRLQSQVTLAAERARLAADLPGWHLFPDEVATFLLTAEYNIASQPDFLDFSTSVISYAKAVEAMLYHRLFVRFRGESGAGDGDCRNKFLQEFMRGERHLTLGSMSIVLASSKEPALRAFVQQLYPRAAETFYAPGGLVERINDPAAVDLRNSAAHDEPLTREHARAARAWALGIMQVL